jgi:hypothetical protein
MISYSATFQMNASSQSVASSQLNPSIWNRDRLYKIRVFGTYQYVQVCTQYILVRNAENGTYLYVLVCTQYVQVF